MNLLIYRELGDPPTDFLNDIDFIPGVGEFVYFKGDSFEVVSRKLFLDVDNIKQYSNYSTPFVRLILRKSK